MTAGKPPHQSVASLEEAQALIAKLEKDYPNEIQSFMSFMQAAENSPAVDRRQKELINVALSIAAQCQWCIALHTKAAIEAGATRDEIMTAGFQAVLMHGGPALMYLTPLVEAIEEFSST